jgi:hypothetical protein
VLVSSVNDELWNKNFMQEMMVLSETQILGILQLSTIVTLRVKSFSFPCSISQRTNQIRVKLN